MPTIGSFRATKKLTLPSSKVEVEFYPSLLIKDVENVDLANTESLKTGVTVLSKLIKTWNLKAKEEDTDFAPINQENISELPVPDIEFLMKEIEMFSAEQKKS